MIAVQSTLPLNNRCHFFYFAPFERLSESGATALGPAALLAIAAASRQPGSKVGLVLILHYNVFVYILAIYSSHALHYTCDL